MGYDRLRSRLVPEPHAVGPTVSTSGLETLGPLSEIPIDRTQNLFRYAGQLRKRLGKHELFSGFSLTRRQFNGIETDTHRGFWSFGADFGNDAITNLRLGCQPNTSLLSATSTGASAIGICLILPATTGG